MSLIEQGKPIAFAIRRRDALQVLNPQVLYSEHYGELKALSKCAYPLGVIGDMLAVVQDGLHGVRRYVPVGVALLGVGNITEDGIDLTEVNRITPEEHERLAASHVSRGDLLVTITGRLGTAALYELDAPANLSAHVALCRAKPGYELGYLKHYLASRFGAASLSGSQIGSTHPHINVRRLVELPIPLPNQTVQRNLAARMDTARSLRREKLRAAEALLIGIDAFLLLKLGLTKPAADARRSYAVRLGEATSEGRLNAEYYHPERRLALRALDCDTQKLDVLPLSSIVTFERDQIKSPSANYLSLAHIESQVGELADVTESASGACFTYRPNDVLFARLRPYLNKVYRAEKGGCCSPEFYVLRIRDFTHVMPDYLAAVLRSRLVLAQTVHMMTGNTHPRLANDEAANLRIPVPCMEDQNAIAEETRRRRVEARRLRVEAESEWRQAKMWFEQQLLKAV